MSSPAPRDAGPFDALLIVSFGGPEGPDDVEPFIQNVLRGRNTPRERVLEVIAHYQQFGGVSPLNAQNRALIAALERDFADAGLKLPIYWGNRNWRPLLPDTLQQMAHDGIRNALAFFTTAYSSYSSCRQYRENIADAQAAVGHQAPRVSKLRACYNHPLFIEANAERLRDALAKIDASRRADAHVVFTAHSIPMSMATTSRYEEQLLETGRLVAEECGVTNWRLAFQSRSGPPTQPWLEPDVSDALRELAAAGASAVVVDPIGFVSDHMEVIYDLDVQAREVSADLGIEMIRAATVGVHPSFVRMVRELVLERLTPESLRPALGIYGPSHDECASDCCPPPRRATPGS